MAKPNFIIIYLLVSGVALLSTGLLYFWPYQVSNQISGRLEGYLQNLNGHSSQRIPPPSSKSLPHDTSSEPSTQGSNNAAVCVDPYREPGYLYIPDAEHYNNTQWIPYSDALLSAPDPSYASYPPPSQKPVYFHPTEPEPEFLPQSPSLFATILTEHYRRLQSSNLAQASHTEHDFAPVKDSADLGWLWGRRFLVIGDSVDRYMVEFTCVEFGYVMRDPRAQTWTSCHIPTFNLTLVQWHSAGMYTLRPEWWWMPDMQQVAFEERWETVWKPTLDLFVRGANGRSPDLVLWQTGLWDQRAMWEAGEFNEGKDTGMGVRERQLVWAEVRFIMARLKKLVEMVKNEFGEDQPMMYRALTIHRESIGQDANLYELDRINRVVARELGSEVFEWGQILRGFSMYYRDKRHIDKGPASFLWADMMFGYMKRIADGKWNDCHQEFVSWGGR